MKVKDTNQIILSGTIVGRQETATLTSIRIATDAYGGRSAYPTVYFYDKSLAEGYKVRDRVHVEGHMQARRITTEEKRSYFQDIVGDNINPMKRLLADYISEEILGKGSLGGWPQDVNEGIVTGHVTHLFTPQPGIKIVSIECRARNYTDYIDITCFQRQANLDLSEGDYIAAACVIRTSTNKKDVRLTDQTLLCKDIARIPEEYVADK